MGESLRAVTHLTWGTSLWDTNRIAYSEEFVVAAVRTFLLIWHSYWEITNLVFFLRWESWSRRSKRRRSCRNAWSSRHLYSRSSPPHKDDEVELKDLFTGQLSHNHVWLWRTLSPGEAPHWVQYFADGRSDFLVRSCHRRLRPVGTPSFFRHVSLPPSSSLLCDTFVIMASMRQTTDLLSSSHSTDFKTPALKPCGQVETNTVLSSLPIPTQMYNSSGIRVARVWSPSKLVSMLLPALLTSKCQSYRWPSQAEAGRYSVWPACVQMTSSSTACPLTTSWVLV